ncbi:hypothetical protein Bca101_032808 [Brassica carinata]
MAMLTESATLEEKYIELCKKHETVPNTSILSAFFEAENKKSGNQRCTMNLLVDRVMYDDFHPMLELCNEINASEVEGIDLSVRSSCSLEDQYVLSLIRSVNQKLHLVDVHGCFGKTLWRDVFSQGLSCEVLNVRSLHFRKLNIVGEFAQLHTLILDSNRVTGFGESCFSCMPNLTCLSMCDTVVSDLWTASAALLKLPSLEVLCEAFVYVIGEDAVEKALELNGRSVGGLNIVATRILPHEPIICGFSPARSMAHLARLAEEQRKKKKQRKKKSKTTE